MIQYYLDLKKQVKSIQELELSYGQIQKIYSTAFYLSLAIRARGKTQHLYLGRGGGYEGVWLHSSPPPSSLRRKDNFLEYLRRHLSSCSFVGVSMDPSDRILKLTYMKFGQEQSMLFFWRARKLYFAHHFQDNPDTPFKMLLSWKGKSFIMGTDALDFFEYFNEIGRNPEMKQEYESTVITSMEDLLNEEERLSALKGKKTNPNFLQRKKENIEDDLRKAKQWEKLQSILDKGESLDHFYELKVEDQKVKFEGDLNPYERRNLLFQKIKKLKRGENILNERLGVVTEQMKGKDTETAAISTLPIIKPVWGKEESEKLIVQPKQTNDEFRTYRFEGFQVGVGSTSQGNDQLRSKWGHKEDYWIHLDGEKSAHAIIKIPSQSLPTSEMFNLAASILAHFSHFLGDWIPIIYTQVKYLKGVSGAPGMVIYKKEKHLRCSRVDISQLVEGSV